MTIKNISLLIRKYLQEDVTPQPYLVVFISTKWSGASSLMKPIIENIRSQFKQDVCFHEISTDKAADIQTELNLSKMPTILLFHQHELIDRIEGIVSKTVLQRKIQSLINHKK